MGSNSAKMFLSGISSHFLRRSAARLRGIDERQSLYFTGRLTLDIVIDYVSSPRLLQVLCSRVDGRIMAGGKPIFAPGLDFEKKYPGHPIFRLPAYLSASSTMTTSGFSLSMIEKSIVSGEAR